MQSPDTKWQERMLDSATLKSAHKIICFGLFLAAVIDSCPKFDGPFVVILWDLRRAPCIDVCRPFVLGAARSGINYAAA